MFAEQFYWELRHIAEGTTRLWFDRKTFAKSIAELEKKQLSGNDRARLRSEADQKVREGHLESSQIHEWLKRREADELVMMHESERCIVAEKADKQLGVPGEPGIFEELLKAKTPDQVRELCKDAFVMQSFEIAPEVIKEVQVPNWPISFGSLLPSYLTEYASEIITARTHPKYPRSKRPSTRLKQIWFLSRALAGAVLGVETRTAVNLVGSIRPEEIFEASRAAKVKRRRRRQIK